MFNFFKKKNTKNNNNELNIAALLVYAAKIDENYTIKEKEIIKKTLLELGLNQKNLEQILISAERIESESNQILNFTKKIKNLDNNYKKKIMESLLKITYSDGLLDMYEDNLIRRISGLLYLDNKIVVELKNKIISNKNL